MKRWCCLFTFLTTRAVYIEVVRSIDTDSCLVALKRFIARRGQPTTILSDNGTDFVGSTRELKEYINSWNQDRITSDLDQKHLVKKFNPPGGPHFGGVWERTIGQKLQESNDVNFRKSFNDRWVVDFNYVLGWANIECARPITPAIDDPSDLEALTPNHFIILSWDGQMFAYLYSQCWNLI